MLHLHKFNVWKRKEFTAVKFTTQKRLHWPVSLVEHPTTAACNIQVSSWTVSDFFQVIVKLDANRGWCLLHDKMNLWNRQVALLLRNLWWHFYGHDLIRTVFMLSFPLNFPGFNGHVCTLRSNDTFMRVLTVQYIITPTQRHLNRLI